MADAHSSSGNQADTIRLFIGYDGASKIPMPARVRINPANELRFPCTSVASNQSVRIKGYNFRGVSPVHHYPTRQLEQRVGQRKGRKNVTHLHGIQLQISFEGRCGNGNITSVEVIDNHRHKNHGEYRKPLPGGFFGHLESFSGLGPMVDQGRPVPHQTATELLCAGRPAGQ